MNWCYYVSGTSGPRYDADDIPMHEYLRLVMWTRVIDSAQRCYSGVPASDALIAREAINVPKKVRDDALHCAVTHGLLERRKERGFNRYHPTDLFTDVILGSDLRASSWIESVRE